MSFPTTISRKLRSNDPPADEEVSIIQENLAVSLEQQHLLETRISHLTTIFDSLSLEQKKLETFLESHTRLLSPFRKLIPEILQEIFYHCLPTAHNAVMSNKEAPLLLGQVCGLWRQVSRTTPKLWASIHVAVTPITSPTSLGGARKEALSSWLSRSGVLPLSISVATSGFWEARRPEATVNAQVQPYFDVLTQHTRRWKTFYITLYDFDWSEFFSKFDGSDFPLLESLSISSDFQRRRDPFSTDNTTLAGKVGILQAPRLRSLSFPSWSLRLLESRVQWKNLIALDFGGHSLPVLDITRILGLCPNLRVCSIMLYATSPGQMTPPMQQLPRTVLPELRTLSINNSSVATGEVSSLLEHLTTPSLRHIFYEQSLQVPWPDEVPRQSYGPRLVRAFASLQHRLTHPLEELTIWTNPFSANCALELLNHVPELKRLSLLGFVSTRVHYQPQNQSYPTLLSDDDLMDDHLLKRFIPSKNSSLPARNDDDGGEEWGDDLVDNSQNKSCLCPNLEVFHCNDALFSKEYIMEFLRRRTIRRKEYPGVAHLRRVSISLNSLRASVYQGEDIIAMLESEIKDLEDATGLLVSLDQAPLVQPALPPPPPIFTSQPLWVDSTNMSTTSGYFGF
ncbi:hypothetical protein AN958_07245 [Leucoagaricus sp. SymC.cos]|nr:hypothetical protein AN958_07245 [Leucoagaricus sp. SymC.cos]